MKRKATWDPLEKVGKAVDTLLSPSAVTSKNKGGRPRTPEHKRIVLYLHAKQVYNLKKAALDRGVDVSTLAREELAKIGY